MHLLHLMHLVCQLIMFNLKRVVATLPILHFLLTILADLVVQVRLAGLVVLLNLVDLVVKIKLVDLAVLLISVDLERVLAVVVVYTNSSHQFTLDILDIPLSLTNHNPVLADTELPMYSNQVEP